MEAIKPKALPFSQVLPRKPVARNLGLLRPNIGLPWAGAFRVIAELSVEVDGNLSLLPGLWGSLGLWAPKSEVPFNAV